MPLIPILALLAAQTTPVPDLPKGTALPPPGTEEGAVMTPVNALFAALAARDLSTVAPLLREGGGATVAEEKPDGTRTVRRVAWAQFAAGVKPGPEKFEERIYSPAIEIDGDVALVWGRYDFLIDGKVHHCGYDHFDLVRENGRWQIANISWSSRTTGCAG